MKATISAKTIGLLMAGAMVSLKGATTPALAQDEGDVKAALAQCLLVKGEEERLKCFERLAEQSSGPAPTTSPSRKPAVSEVTPTQRQDRSPTSRSPRPQSPKDDFGAERLDRPEDKAAEQVDKSMVYTVAIVSKDRLDRLLFHTVSGQIWRQIERGYISYPKRGNFQVRIRQGGFGDYKLRVGGKGKMTRVKRIK